jgi:hypothetical protein
MDENQKSSDDGPIDQVTLDRGIAAIVDAICKLERRVEKLEQFFCAQQELNKKVKFVLHGHQASIETLAAEVGIKTPVQIPPATLN